MEFKKFLKPQKLTTEIFEASKSDEIVILDVEERILPKYKNGVVIEEGEEEELLFYKIQFDEKIYELKGSPSFNQAIAKKEDIKEAEELIGAKIKLIVVESQYSYFMPHDIILSKKQKVDGN